MENQEVINELFKTAKENGNMQYVFTLLRICGIESYSENPITTFEKLLDNHESIDNLALLKSIVGNFVWLSVIYNLISNGKGNSHCPLPFNVTYPKSCNTSREDNLFLRGIFSQLNEESSLKQKMQEVFGNELFSENNVDINSLPQEYLNTHLNGILQFAKDFISIYKQILFNFKDDAGYMKIASFTTFELLRDDVVGLVGFKAYFSNGSHAEYVRSNTGARGVNFLSDIDGISFMVGDLAQLKQIWMVENTPLYQIGARGRYNNFGEWKPLEYPGSSGALEGEIRKLLGDIEDSKHNIYGCLQYIIATCHKNIEFIVEGDFDLPNQPTVYSSGFGDIYMHKIDLGDQVSNILGNQRFYDCSIIIPETTVESIQQGLFYIQDFVNELAFALDVKAEWFLKYPMSQNISGVLQVHHDDIDKLNGYLVNQKISSEDRRLIAAAISWFINGNNSNNIYTSYLCYYIAFEVIASSLVRGDMDISDEYGFVKKTKAEKKSLMKTCIQILHDENYSSDPVKFVQDSYFSCIISIREHTELALKAIFGENHPYLKDFYEKTEGVSVYSLRSKLAHGEFSFVNTDHEKAVQQKLPILREITHEFITRVSYGLKSTDNVERPAAQRSAMFSMGDPRSTGITNNLNILPIKDWKIRPEWLS